MELPFWDKLTDAQRALLESNTATIRAEAGQVIHGGGADCVGLLRILRGSLRAYMLSGEGREITLYRLRRGEICVLSASCALSEITFEVFVEAQEATEIAVTRSEAFARVREESIYASEFAYRLAAERFSDVMFAMQQILFLSLDRRLAAFLTAEIERTGGSTVYMTHEQIATHMATAREVVSRMLKYFASEGLVGLSRGGVSVRDKARLRALAGTD